MGGWTDKDTQKETGDSSGKIAEAEHDARDHATKSGDFSRGDSVKNSERFSHDSSAGKMAADIFKEIFGK